MLISTDREGNEQSQEQHEGLVKRLTSQDGYEDENFEEAALSSSKKAASKNAGQDDNTSQDKYSSEFF